MTNRALAFVIFEGEHHTIGYVVSELVEEVHSTIDSGSILSVDFAWVCYNITDWSRSGPVFFFFFFAGISIAKRGRWSDAAVQYSSTKRQ